MQDLASAFIARRQARDLRPGDLVMRHPIATLDSIAPVKLFRRVDTAKPSPRSASSTDVRYDDGSRAQITGSVVVAIDPNVAS